MNGMVLRGALSVLAVLLYGWINFLLNPLATLVSADVAGRQFDNSATSYIQAVYGMRFFGGLGVPALVLAAVLLAIWWKPLRLGWTKLLPPAAAVLGMLLATTGARLKSFVSPAA